MTYEGYATVRAQFFCRECGHRFTAAAEVSDGGKGSSYSVGWRNKREEIAEDECPFCGSDDTQIFRTWPRKGGVA